MSPIIKRKGERFTLPSKYLLFILTVLCTGLMILTFGTNILDAPLNTGAGYIVVPFQEGISKIGNYLNDRAEELGQIKALLAENEKLREENADLTVENTTLMQERYELLKLRELYKLDAQYSDYEKVGARIIARDTGNWYHSFTIDKGSNDGLMVDMNVMAEGGLVGRITEVGPNWSKIISIISDNSNVSGKVLATGDNLIVSGELELMQDGVIRFEQLLDSREQVAEGDKIVTSDISDKYLPGILIGSISEITLDANKLTKSGYLIPAVDFEHLDVVLVLMELKQTLEEK
ncbi:MAG: rod shape-determining protein MreC [Lachnospiraceae bacterium]|nr:rod shape-determining protein MreC [Lachnospiraceae bacterium]